MGSWWANFGIAVGLSGTWLVEAGPEACCSVFVGSRSSPQPTASPIDKNERPAPTYHLVCIRSLPSAERSLSPLGAPHESGEFGCLSVKPGHRATVRQKPMEV